MTMFDTILNDARNGDQQSLMSLYDICCTTVFNASFRILLNEQDAEEVTQDAILKAFSLLHSFKGTQRDFVAFVKTIAINKSIDEYRKFKRLPLHVDIKEISYDKGNNDNDDEIFSIDKVKKAIDDLPEGYRLVITLRLLEEMEYEDIANTLNINASSVRSQYSRGIAKLREVLRVKF